jgi:hypothetical protein
MPNYSRSRRPVTGSTGKALPYKIYPKLPFLFHITKVRYPSGPLSNPDLLSLIYKTPYMKKIIALFSTFLIIVGVKAQTTPVKKETTRPATTKPAVSTTSATQKIAPTSDKIAPSTIKGQPSTIKGQPSTAKEIKGGGTPSEALIRREPKAGPKKTPTTKPIKD